MLQILGIHCNWNTKWTLASSSRSRLKAVSKSVGSLQPSQQMPAPSLWAPRQAVLHDAQYVHQVRMSQACNSPSQRKKQTNSKTANWNKRNKWPRRFLDTCQPLLNGLKNWTTFSLPQTIRQNMQKPVGGTSLKSKPTRHHTKVITGIIQSRLQILKLHIIYANICQKKSQTSWSNVYIITNILCKQKKCFIVGMEEVRKSHALNELGLLSTPREKVLTESVLQMTGKKAWPCRITNGHGSKRKPVRNATCIFNTTCGKQHKAEKFRLRKKPEMEETAFVNPCSNLGHQEFLC